MTNGDGGCVRQMTWSANADERSDGNGAPAACTCALGDRVAMYESLALLLAGPSAEAGFAVERIERAKIPCIERHHVTARLTAEAFDAARAALRTTKGVEDFRAERARVLGEERFDPFENLISPYETTYLAVRPADVLESVRSVYRIAGFTPRQPVRGTEAACHIGVELDFMAHCLDQVAWGDDRFLTLVGSFFEDHVRQWALLFAVALSGVAVDPALRFTACALDAFISCEARTFRCSAPRFCSQCALLA